MAGGQFRSSQWDPVLIICQIVAVQCVFYTTFGGCIILVDFIVGAYRSVDHLFVYQMMNPRDLHGKLLLGASIVNAAINGASLWYIVQRTKQCWDFATTVYITHIVICIVVNGSVATTASWWFTTIFAAIVMTVAGELLCMRTEMKAIPLGGSSKVDL